MRDWLRIGPALLWWNSRKTLYRLRGARGRTPCQSASDSGRAFETRCEACTTFDCARRFRFVCPDLVTTPEGLRCRVNAADIRPHWLHAATLILGFALISWLAGTTAVWGGLRIFSFDTLPWLDVVVPSRWDNLAEIRRRHFGASAAAAVAKGDLVKAQLALQSAAADPSGWREGVAAGRLAYFTGQYAFGDSTFRTLLAQTPAQATVIAVSWHDAMLVAGDYEGVARLALDRIGAEPASANEPWWRAFFEIIRQPGLAARLLAANFTSPPPGFVEALAARDAIDRHDPAAPARLEAFAAVSTSVWAYRFLIESWLDLGRGPEAWAVLTGPHRPDDPAKRGLAAYAIDAFTQGDARAQAVFPRLLEATALEPAHLEGLLAALIRQPCPANLALLHARLPDTLRADPGFAAGLWIAARINDTPVIANAAAQALAAAGRPIAEKFAVLDLHDTRPGANSPRGCVAALLPIDREILYALRFAPRPLQSQSPP